jgi:hypothetical protein
MRLLNRSTVGPSCSKTMSSIETRSIPAYTTQRSTRYVLPISIATYGSLYIILLALWKNRTSIYSALYRTVLNIYCWTNQVLWVMLILRSWLLLPNLNLPVVHLLAPLRPCRLQRTSCLTCCLLHQLVHATKTSPPTLTDRGGCCLGLYPVYFLVFSRKTRGRTGILLEPFCRIGHNIITDFNLLSPILSGLRLPRL